MLKAHFVDTDHMPSTDKPIKKPSLFAATPVELQNLICDEWGFPAFRAKQMIQWIFVQRESSLSSMGNLPKALREKLAEHFDCSLPEISSQLDGDDGATKLLLKGKRDQLFETVILRYEGRTSLCVSSQVGCKLACSFCQTGKLGFFRNLDAGEIVAQFLIANNIVAKENRKISHIVFMGMGEPLDNFDNVLRSVNLFTEKDCFGLSKSRVTVSTSGVVSKIMPLAEKSQCSLAVSLHASRDELRTDMMPINRKYPLATLKKELMAYQLKTQQKITIEYILIHNKNCGLREAKELVKFLHGLKAKVNLIPFNTHPGMGLQRPSENEITEFQSYLSSRGYPAPVRYSKGLGVSAACGQLAAKQIESLEEKPRRKSVIA